MNQFFYESRGKEKVKDLMKEGMGSQAYHRSRAPKPSLLNGLPKLILILLGILGILELLVG
jgi:hypothetical protein